MAGKIDASHVIRPLGVATASTAHVPEKAAAEKEKEKKATASEADAKGWKAAHGQQANPHKQQAVRAGDPKPPRELASNLATVREAAEVPGRFASDLETARPELVNHPALLRADKAQRLFEFSVPYAQAVVTKSTTQEQRKEVAAELLIRAEQGGYGLLQPQDASGKNGLAALRELLEAQRPEQLAELAATFSFDIPAWPSDAQMLAEARAAATEQQALVQAGVAPTAHAPGPLGQGDEEADDEPALRDRTNKRLGSHMLWNVLHLFRDDGEDGRESAEQRDAKTQAFLIAGVMFVLLALIVAAFVSM